MTRQHFVTNDRSICRPTILSAFFLFGCFRFIRAASCHYSVSCSDPVIVLHDVSLIKPLSRGTMINVRTSKRIKPFSVTRHYDQCKE